MNLLDAFVYGVVLLSVAYGAWRGLFSSLFGITAVVLAFVIAARGGDLLLPFLSSALDGSPLARVIAPVGTFFAAYLVLGGAARALAAGMRRMDAGGVDAGGGALFGLLRGGLLSLLAVLMLSATAFHKSETWQKSDTVPQLGAALAQIAATPVFAPYREWLRFDARQRPRLVDPNPASGAQESAAPAAAEEEEESADGLLHEVRQKTKAENQVLEDVVDEMGSEGLEGDGQDVPTEIKDKGDVNEIAKAWQAIRQYAFCELDGGKDCALWKESSKQ